MNRIKLIFGTYNSQPVGSTQDQLETVYKNSYRPYLKLLYAYPKVKAVIHYSGNLLEWFTDKHPEIVLLMNEMIKRRQIELLGGPYYNPILSIIPNKDRISQIELQTTYIRKHFRKRPRGCWIPEKIWEPTLSSNLKNSGMEYTFLDSDLFKKSGIKGYDLNKVYITEDQGKSIYVFPIDESLSKEFIEPEKIIESLLAINENGNSEIISMMLDGSSRQVEEACLKDGWFENLFELLTENTRRIQTINPGLYIRNLGSSGKVYFPCSTEKHYFRQNFTRYTESNLLYSKMIYMHHLASQVKRDKVRKKNAREEIMMSQSNTVYWHGNLPGVYDNFLRKKAYSHLIDAEKSSREKGIFTTSLTTTDFDCDGMDEYIYQGQYINAYVHNRGGVIFELDYLVNSWNYLDTMSRYKEPYHTGEHERNGFDWYPRNAFVDHFLEDECTQEDFSGMTYNELGNFVDSEYSLVDLNREKKELDLQFKGQIKINRIKKSIRITKKFDFKKNSIQVKYIVSNLSVDNLKINFASEINLSLDNISNGVFIKTSSGKEVYEKKTPVYEESGISDFIINEVSRKVTITVTGSEKFTLWKFPVETETKRLETIEKIYQSTCFVLKWPIAIDAGKEWSSTITIRLEKTR